MPNRLDTESQIFFYENDFYVFSNFSSFTLKWPDWKHGKLFPTSEHCYHWLKFEHPKAPRLIQRIIACAPSAHEAFEIAQRYKEHLRPNWDDIKVNVMRRIIRAKIDQHMYVRKKLVASYGRELIEDSWRDDFWGWGPNRDGQNMLGKLWMELRAEILS